MAMRPVRALVLCICAVLLSSPIGHAKVKITFTPKQAVKYEARPESCEIQVFKDSKPDRTYIDLGVINYHDERHRLKDGSLTLDVAMPRIKAKACTVGADALVDIRVTEVRRLEFAMFNVRVTAVRFAAN
jgi:hypothetical protein